MGLRGAQRGVGEIEDDFFGCVIAKDDRLGLENELVVGVVNAIHGFDREAKSAEVAGLVVKCVEGVVDLSFEFMERNFVENACGRQRSDNAVRGKTGLKWVGKG